MPVSGEVESPFSKSEGAARHDAVRRLERHHAMLDAMRSNLIFDDVEQEIEDGLLAAERLMAKLSLKWAQIVEAA
jgi:hypothetical protein